MGKKRIAQTLARLAEILKLRVDYTTSEAEVAEARSPRIVLPPWEEGVVEFARAIG